MSSVLQQFLGPIEAIIVQVQEREIDLFDIDLTKLAQDFQKEGIKLVEGAKFIAGLAHLMYLKALHLIPQEEESAEEAPFEESSELFLEEYTSFKEVAQLFSVKEREQSFHFPRKPFFEVVEPQKPTLAPAISLEAFSKLFAEMLEQAERRTVTISEDMYTLQDMLIALRRRLKRARIAFSVLFSPDLGKSLLIVTFLSVLELMKNQEAALVVESETLFVEKVA